MRASALQFLTLQREAGFTTAQPANEAGAILMATIWSAEARPPAGPHDDQHEEMGRPETLRVGTRKIWVPFSDS